MQEDMPVGYPRSHQFTDSQKRQQDTECHWQRGPGSGGQNYGRDFNVPAGHFVVGYEVVPHSLFGNDGDPVKYLDYDIRGMLNVPVGVHVGVRLEPGRIGGGGASYKFTVRIQYVTEADWYRVADRPLPEIASNDFVNKTSAETEDFGRSTLDVHNRDDSAVWVKVSKTLGRGQDGYFRIEPGATERWRRHVGYRVTIKIDYYGDGDADLSYDHKIGISSGENKFEVNGGAFSRV
jgi:hypothetical protein